MGQVTFEIKGLNRKRLRKWVRCAQPGILSSSLGLLVAAGLGGMFLLEKALPDFVSLLSGAKIVNVGCVPIIGQKIALVVDISKSMETDERQTVLKTQIETMEEKGMTVIKYEVMGLGIADNYSRNLLQELRTIFIEANTNVPDTIFILSDFEKVDPDTKMILDYWKTTVEGFAELHDILSQNKARLYLGTVKFLPSVEMPKLLAIAERSGGGEINFAALQDGQSLCF